MSYAHDMHGPEQKDRRAVQAPSGPGQEVLRNARPAVQVERPGPPGGSVGEPQGRRHEGAQSARTSAVRNRAGRAGGAGRRNQRSGAVARRERRAISRLPPSRRAPRTGRVGERVVRPTAVADHATGASKGATGSPTHGAVRELGAYACGPLKDGPLRGVGGGVTYAERRAEAIRPRAHARHAGASAPLRHVAGRAWATSDRNLSTGGEGRSPRLHLIRNHRTGG